MVVAVQYISKEQGGEQSHDVTGILAVQGAFAEHAAAPAARGRRLR
jgi:5'-phosphate synthase pdxT subunit